MCCATNVMSSTLSHLGMTTASRRSLCRITSRSDPAKARCVEGALMRTLSSEESDGAA